MNWTSKALCFLRGPSGNSRHCSEPDPKSMEGYKDWKLDKKNLTGTAFFQARLSLSYMLKC